jgi:hypothetical protein
MKKTNAKTWMIIVKSKQYQGYAGLIAYNIPPKSEPIITGIVNR